MVTGLPQQVRAPVPEAPTPWLKPGTGRAPLISSGDHGPSRGAPGPRVCFVSFRVGRYAQGAFRIALKALYAARLRAHRVPEETIDEKVGTSFRQWGKPTEVRNETKRTYYCWTGVRFSIDWLWC